MIVGIDFGTTNSVVAYIDKDKRPNVIINERGNRLTPSIVYFKNENEVYVGEIAKSQILLKPDQTIAKVKRKIGTTHTYKIFEKEYKPYEIAAFIFKKLKQYTEEFLDSKIEKAVVTVPAYFNDNQRQGVVKAATIADIEVVKLLNEPTAASLAYSIESDEEKIVLVLDLGGGTFDITIIKQSKGLHEVLATGGSTELGGIDFDRILVDWIVEEFKAETDIDLSEDLIAIQQIYNAVEKAKIDLSNVTETNIVIPYISMSENGPLHINKLITQKLFEALSKELIEKIHSLIGDTLKEAGLKEEEIDVLVFSGGASRMPFFRKLTEKFPNAEVKSEINPDEVVAIGAAIQGGMIDETIENIKLRDVLPHSLGILDDEGNFVEIIPKGTTYPVTSTEMFTNTKDDQDTVTIQILQENDENMVSLGKFHFKSSRKWKKGEANIAVTFSLNKNGILEVSAEDVDTGEIEEVTVTETVFQYKDIDIKNLNPKIS